MKRLIAAVLVFVMVLSVMASSFAWEETWVINPKSGGSYKKAPTNHAMPDSGSYWRATYKSGTWTTGKGYIYKVKYGQVTSDTSFPKGTEVNHLEYTGPKIVNDMYYFVGSGVNGTSVTYEYHF